MTSALDGAVDGLNAGSEQLQQSHGDDISDAHFGLPGEGHNGYFSHGHSALFGLPQQQQHNMAFEQQQAAYLHQLALQQQQQLHQHSQHTHSQHFPQRHQQPSTLISRLPPHSQQQPPPCRLYAQGYCRFGEQCRYSHGATASHSPAPALLSAMQLPAPPPPPPGLEGAGYQHQPHIHAAMIAQQMEALRMQQANNQRSQYQHQQLLHAAKHSSHEQQGGDKGASAEDGSSDEKEQDSAGASSGGDGEPDKNGAVGGEDDSEAASTPRSTAPSSTATTYMSSSNSSPSALSANATPFSSSFSSPASSSQHQSPFLQPAYPTMLPPGKLAGHNQLHSFPHFPNPNLTSHSMHNQSQLRMHQPFSMSRHTAPFVPAHAHPHGQMSHSQLLDYQPAHHQRDIEARDPEREAELFGSTSTGVNFDKYDDIAVDAQGNGVQPPIAFFTDLPLPDFLQHNIDAAHYVKPTPIQKHALPNALAGRDIMACAQTGSGKTAAFLFPLISMLLSSQPPSQFVSSSISGYGRQKVYHPAGLVLAPTRELATQIHDEASKFISFSPLSSACVYGGQDIRVQFRELDRGCDILVATPGRLMDMVDRGRISLQAVRYLVLDEADRMLDMGFEPQIRALVEGKDMLREGRQTLMFSATFPKEIQRLAQDFLYNYIFIAVGRVGSSSDFIRQSVEYVEDDDKQAALLRLLPLCSGLTLVFVERKRTADMLERHLQLHGIAAASIHGDRSQHERENALSLFRSGRCPVLVATDVAARGLDIPNVTDVINFDMPSAIDDYVHRIGRTGRAGREGSSTAFFNSKSGGVVRELVELLHENKQDVPGWLEDMYAQAGRVGGGAGRGGRGRGRWGARDFRQGQFGPSAGRGRGGRGGGGFSGWRGGGLGGMSTLGAGSLRQSNGYGDMLGGLGGAGGGLFSHGAVGYDNSGFFTGGFVGGFGAQRS